MPRPMGGKMRERMKIKLSEIKETSPKRDHGDVDSLKRSIADVGLLHPLVVDSEYRLMAGRRRFQVVTELRWEEVDVRIIPVNGDQLKAFRIAIDENLKRKPLTDVEVATAIDEYDELKRKMEGEKSRGNPNLLQCDKLGGWTQQQTADDLGISQPAVVKAKQIAKAVKEYPDLAAKPGQQIMSEYRRRQPKDIPNLPTGKYQVIYADPPWEYEFSQSESRSIEAHYPTMTTEEICELKNRIPTNSDAVLFLWATNPKIEEALSVIEAWGFEYKTNMVWVKDKIGLGYYWRQQHELLLLARKGNMPIPDPANRTSSVLVAPRLGHSQKPGAVYEMIEHMYPKPANYPNDYYLELFARVYRTGWDSWGLGLR